MSTTTIIYNLKPYLAQNAAFFHELQIANSEGVLPIHRIFQILPLNVVRPFNGRQQLEQRGDGTFRRTGTEFLNDAAHANVITFRDDQLGEISVTFPRRISIHVTSNGTIEVVSNGELITVHFAALPTDFPIVQPIHFSKFSISLDRMVTVFICLLYTSPSPRD